MAKRIYCSIPNCEGRRPRNGLCPKHGGIARFWERVPHRPADGCWDWCGVITPNGYGQHFAEGKNIGAHRYSYELLVGPIAADLHLDHLCRNRKCVNPEHLEAVLPKVNILRGVGPGAKNAQKTSCENGHEFTADNTKIVNGRRVCRECTRKYQREWRMAKRREEGVPEWHPRAACLEPDCPSLAHAKGLCSKHYQRANRRTAR